MDHKTHRHEDTDFRRTRHHDLSARVSTSTRETGRSLQRAACPGQGGDAGRNGRRPSLARGVRRGLHEPAMPTVT